jgi:hypothetical protein
MPKQNVRKLKVIHVSFSPASSDNGRLAEALRLLLSANGGGDTGDVSGGHIDVDGVADGDSNTGGKTDG